MDAFTTPNLHPWDMDCLAEIQSCPQTLDRTPKGGSPLVVTRHLAYTLLALLEREYPFLDKLFDDPEERAPLAWVLNNPSSDRFKEALWYDAERAALDIRASLMDEGVRSEVCQSLYEKVRQLSRVQYLALEDACMRVCQWAEDEDLSGVMMHADLDKVLPLMFAKTPVLE